MSQASNFLAICLILAAAISFGIAAARNQPPIRWEAVGLFLLAVYFLAQRLAVTTP